MLWPGGTWALGLMRILNFYVRFLRAPVALRPNRDICLRLPGRGDGGTRIIRSLWKPRHTTLTTTVKHNRGTGKRRPRLLVAAPPMAPPAGRKECRLRLRLRLELEPGAPAPYPLVPSEGGGGGLCRWRPTAHRPGRGCRCLLANGRRWVDRHPATRTPRPSSVLRTHNT